MHLSECAQLWSHAAVDLHTLHIEHVTLKVEGQKEEVLFFHSLLKCVSKTRLAHLAAIRLGERLQIGKQLLHAVLWNDSGAAQTHRCHLLHVLLANPSLLLWCVGLWWWWWLFFLGQFGLWCLHVCPIVQKSKGSGGFFLTCFWASLERF